MHVAEAMAKAVETWDREHPGRKWSDISQDPVELQNHRAKTVGLRKLRYFGC